MIEYSHDELKRLVMLRAIEWRHWPIFLAIGVGQILLLVNIYFAFFVVFLLDFLWGLIVNRFINFNLARFGVYVNQLKWITTPIVAFVVYKNSGVGLAVLVLFWPLILSLLPIEFITEIIPRKPVGYFEEKFGSQIFSG